MTTQEFVYFNVYLRLVKTSLPVNLIDQTALFTDLWGGKYVFTFLLIYILWNVHNANFVGVLFQF